MWQGSLGFFAGVIVAIVMLWTFVCRRARQPLLDNQKELQARIDDLNGQLETALAALTLSEKKAREYFDTIEGVVKERTDWAERYQRMATEHGNAQDLMMQTIEGLCRHLEKLGKKVEIPPVIRAVRAAFFGSHIQAKKESG